MLGLGEVLVFLDSHCEVNEMWLQPLLTPIKENRHTVVCPVIDIISADTLIYSPSPIVRGGFNWGLHFKWDPVPPAELNSPSGAIRYIAALKYIMNNKCLKGKTFFPTKLEDYN